MEKILKNQNNNQEALDNISEGLVDSTQEISEPSESVLEEVAREVETQEITEECVEVPADENVAPEAEPAHECADALLDETVEESLDTPDKSQESECVREEDAEEEPVTDIPEQTEEAPVVTNIPKTKKPILTTEKMVGIGIFSALAFVVSLFIRFPVQFLTFDAKDAVITIAAFVYGPLSAVIISLIVAFIEMITISDTMWYGFLMNFASSAIFAVTASLIYRKKRNLNGAIIGLYSAIAATVGIMIILNIFVTPLYFGMPVAAPMVMEMLPTLLLPFNFAKALMNSAIVMFVYKPMVTMLKRIGIVKTQGGQAAMTFNRTTKIIIALGAVGLALSISIFLILVL